MDQFTTLLSRMVLQESAKPSCQKSGCNNGHNLKSCARCGIASYCSKECQVADWKTHKKVCSKLSPHKEDAKNEVLGNPILKHCLLSLTFDLPPIGDEYERRYKQASFKETLYIQMALQGTQEMIETNIENLLEDDYSQASLLKRWQEVSPELSAFLLYAKPGDIYRAKQTFPLQQGPPQQFRNSPLAERGVIRNGDRVVDIGFVDFGMMFDSTQQIVDGGEQVVVMGIEAAPFNVAKSLVMTHMMKNPATPARSVVEVWMSSLWSKKTFTYFKESTRAILELDVELEDKVKSIVQFWSVASKVTAAAAMEQQKTAAFGNMDTTFAMKCCSLSRERDRVEYLRYYFTKALYEDSTTVLGSIVMCSEKAMIGVTQLYADGMEAVPSYVHMPMDHDFQPEMGTMDRICYYYELNMERLMRLMRSGTIDFRPMLGIVSTNNTTLIRQVTAMKPHVIHWSNVIDYITPRDFHKIAHAMSGTDTIHYVHSCNWTSRVYGVDVFEVSEQTRLYFFCAGLQLLESSYATMDGFTKYGAPHFRTLCTLVLARRFVKSYFRMFFEGQDVSCDEFDYLADD